MRASSASTMITISLATMSSSAPASGAISRSKTESSLTTSREPRRTESMRRRRAIEYAHGTTSAPGVNRPRAWCIWRKVCWTRSSERARFSLRAAQDEGGRAEARARRRPPRRRGRLHSRSAPSRPTQPRRRPRDSRAENDRRPTRCRGRITPQRERRRDEDDVGRAPRQAPRLRRHEASHGFDLHARHTPLAR